MREVTYGDGVLFLKVGKEWSLVVDFKIEYSVLVWETDFGAVNGGIGGGRGWSERDTVEGRKHRDFELEQIIGWDGERQPCVP